MQTVMPSAEPQSRLKVLVVDDDPVSRASVVFLLAKDGIRVDEAADGQDALVALDRANADRAYDLLITDYRMPRLDGRGLLMAVEAMPKKPYVLLMSSEPLDQIREEGAVGFDVFAPKPVKLSTIREVLLRAGTRCND